MKSINRDCDITQQAVRSRGLFLQEMAKLIPWQRLTAVINKQLPQPASAYALPADIETFLKIFFIQHWFNLTDSEALDVITDSSAMRRFLKLGDQPAFLKGFSSAIIEFRRLLQCHNISEVLLSTVDAYLNQQGVKIAQGFVSNPRMVSRAASSSVH